MGQDALRIAKQADPKKYEHAVVNVTRGITSYGPLDEDALQLVGRGGLIAQQQTQFRPLLDILEDIHHVTETCADCGVRYVPTIATLRARAESRLNSIATKHPLDALSRADQLHDR